MSVGEISVAAKPTPVYVIDCGEREVVICPYKEEISTGDKNAASPLKTIDGKEMKVPGFILDFRIPCTPIKRFCLSSITSTI